MAHVENEVEESLFVGLGADPKSVPGPLVGLGSSWVGV